MKMKPNKLNIGDVVKPKKSYIKWEIDHMVEMYRIGGNSHNVPVFDFNSLHQISMWRGAYLGMKTLGKIVGYGSGDGNGIRCVKVQLVNKMGVAETNLDEKDLILVKRGKKSK